MIRYALKCSDGHTFESWFQSAAAFDALAGQGHLSCAVCGSDAVSKTMMSPQVAAEKESGAPAKPTRNEAIAEMRREVEKNATYVGGDFVRKAREMHEGAMPATSIYGEADVQEVRALVEEGVPVLPLPFKPKQKMQ